MNPNPSSPDATPPRPGDLIAELVRAASREGRLITAAELEAAYRESFGPGPEDFAAELEAALAGHGDLARLPGAGGREYFHSLRHLSATYAGILARRGDPLLLIAATVRENSQLYPRPLALDVFNAEPFGLTPEVIREVLHGMHGNPTYVDIAAHTTTTGAIYLYSTRHLDHGYAAFLAERIETGLVDNP